MNNYEGEWLQELTERDFPSQYRDLVQLIGVEATVKLSIHFGGLQFYVPKPDALLQKKRDEMIRRDARVIGYRKTALRFKLSEMWVRQICDHRNDASGLKQEGLF